AVAAAASVAIHHPAGVCSLLLAGRSMSLWDASPSRPEKAAPSDKASAIDPDILFGIEDRAPVRNAEENYNEIQAYNYLLIQAHKTATSALAKGARRDLTFAHLFEEPSKYRGQLIHVEGLLRRLRKFDTARLAAKEGVPVLYEGWIFDADHGNNPYCVIVSE